jgi:hypothetical protein
VFCSITPIRQQAIAICVAAVAQQDPALARVALGHRERILILLAKGPTVERVGSRGERLSAVFRPVVVAVGVASLALGSAVAVRAGGDGAGHLLLHFPQWLRFVRVATSQPLETQQVTENATQVLNVRL